MHINNYKFSKADEPPKPDVHLQLLLAQPTDKQLRPCPGCDIKCSCIRHSSTCCCSCSPACPHAPKRLSSEPAVHPIEPKVLPLVYGLSELRLVQPCWSCEGHTRNNKQIHKLPQVWFYSHNVVYPQLIAEHLHNLRVKHELNEPWHVTVSPFSADNLVGTFLIKPELDKGVSNISLEKLQWDLRLISDNFAIHVRKFAHEMLNSNSRTAA